MDQKLKIGVSACLLGQEVRFNAGHCQNDFLTKNLAPYVEFTPFCPEAAIGMGIPREAVRLVYDDDARIHMIAPKSNTDFTDKMETYSHDQSDSLHKLDLDGYVFKKDSPSCGVFRVKIYTDKQPTERKGRGLFAKAIIAKYPELPVEEDGRLSDPILRENFMERIFAFRRVKDLFKTEWTRKEIVDFHSCEKLLLMAHSPKLYKEIGQLVAHIADYSRDEFKTIYIKTFMTAINTRSTKGRHHNTLSHMAGYLKKKLSPESHHELLNSIDEYRKGIVPLIVPITLLRHLLRRFEETYLLQQSYLSPHPHEMALRNHV
jgi:uncharacterized protein YbgA (DUF1722 family)/uncharacterized protein YbbK (DUF523 family)